MNDKTTRDVFSRLTLDMRVASDLMTPNPVSLRQDATYHEAVALLIDRCIGAAPVIDEAGRPVGVLSLVDIVIHDRESGVDIEGHGSTRVRDMMTPGVFSFAPDSSARRVVDDMVALKVHRLFAVDSDGILTGVITALDVLKHLHPERLLVPDPVPASIFT